MSEEEERILVLEATKDDFIYKHFNGKGFIPRADVIERIKKAMCYGLCNADCVECKNKAEAALNALLSKED